MDKDLRLVTMVVGGHLRVAMEILRRSQARVSALLSVLTARGLVTAEEIEAATKEIEADRAVTEALNRQVAAYDELFNRLVDGEDVPDAEVRRLLREAAKDKEEPAA
jgi:cell division protein FtsB